MIKPDKLAIMAVVLVSSNFPPDIFTTAPPPPCGTDGQLSGKQGEVVVVRVPPHEQATAVTGRFLNRTIPFFQDTSSDSASTYVGLVGVDLQDAAGTHELVLDVVSPAGPR